MDTSTTARDRNRSSATSLGLATIAAALLLAGHAGAAGTPEQKCESGKNGVIGKYAGCMHKAWQKFATGQTGEPGLLALETACAEKATDKWADLETKAGPGICPSEGDDATVRAFLDPCIGAVEQHLAGGTLPLDVETCNAELEECLGTSGIIRTGATQCSDSTGMVIPCAGTGQDAEYQAGITASYTDNGDGTVTDNVSGLMWEKLSDDGSIHDKDDTYTWANAFAVKIANLNATNFAGYNDWRLPNIRELQSIVNFGTTNPSTYPELHNACMPGCTVLTCGCNIIASFWTSTTVNTGASAWVIYFSEGRTIFTLKTGTFYVRAVRGGV